MQPEALKLLEDMRQAARGVAGIVAGRTIDQYRCHDLDHRVHSEGGQVHKHIFSGGEQGGPGMGFADADRSIRARKRLK